MDNLEDPINSTLFEQTINSFCHYARTNMNLYQLSDYLELFKKSPILNLILSDPGNATAIACLNSILANKHHLPRSFSNLFIALASTKITLQKNHTLSDINTFVVNVNTNNLNPNSKITNMTCESMKRELARDKLSNTSYSESTHKVLPQSVKINLTNDMMDLMVLAANDLNETIIEGYRRNGKTGDSFIKERITK